MQNNAKDSGLMTPEEFKELQEVTRFESELINRRVTWLLGSQTLLFAGIGAASAGARQDVLKLVYIVGCSLGFVTSFGLSLGIAAAVFEIHRTFGIIEGSAGRQDSHLFRRRSSSPVTMFLGEGSALLLPLTFVVAWGVLLGRYLFFTEEFTLWRPNELLLGLVFGPLLVAALVTVLVTPGLLTHSRGFFSKTRASGPLSASRDTRNGSSTNTLPPGSQENKLNVQGRIQQPAPRKRKHR